MYDNDFARVLDLKIFLLYKNTIRIGHKFHYLDRFLPIQRYNTIDVQTTQISTDHHHCKRGYLLLSLSPHGFDQRINERIINQQSISTISYFSDKKALYCKKYKTWSVTVKPHCLSAAPRTNTCNRYVIQLLQTREGYLLRQSNLPVTVRSVLLSVAKTYSSVDPNSKETSISRFLSWSL